jgi:hypothetical protein
MCIICDERAAMMKIIRLNNPSWGYDAVVRYWATANPAAHFHIGQKCTCAAERTEAEHEKEEKTLERRKFLAENRDLVGDQKVLRSGKIC